jgi:transcriptional regulator with XRE-family HTH domain
MNTCEKNINELFGQTIRQLRESKKWSQEELADRADLNRSYVGEIERGDVMPSLGTASKLAQAFGLKLSSLLSQHE